MQFANNCIDLPVTPGGTRDRFEEFWREERSGRIVDFLERSTSTRSFLSFHQISLFPICDPASPREKKNSTLYREKNRAIGSGRGEQSSIAREENRANRANIANMRQCRGENGRSRETSFPSALSSAIFADESKSRRLIRLRSRFRDVTPAAGSSMDCRR